ncbi:MAG: PAS domain-containing protein [Rhodospirillales bacterium]|nr:PAS domain-containing protein [Rhodospirillales bacterium]
MNWRAQLVPDLGAATKAPAATLPPPDRLHPTIRALYEHWLSIHPASGLPGRQHFDPVAVPRLLANVWLLDLERDPWRFRYRVIGSALVQAGTPVRTGDWLHEVLPDKAQRAGMEALFLQAIESRAPAWRRGAPTIAHDRFISELEVIVLPLARDGVTVDNLLNATVFYWQAR